MSFNEAPPLEVRGFNGGLTDEPVGAAPNSSEFRGCHITSDSTISATNVRVVLTASSSTNTDGAYDLICMGPR